MTPTRFFFYGTLAHRAGNDLTRALAPKIARRVPASLPGRLFAVISRDGAYPALVEGGIDGPVVKGTVYEMNARFSEADLARLDAYEECFPEDAARSLYIRAERQVRLFDGRKVAADTYIYARPLPRTAPLIPQGDFWAWIERRGGKAFAEGRR